MKVKAADFSLVIRPGAVLLLMIMLLLVYAGQGAAVQKEIRFVVGEESYSVGDLSYNTDAATFIRDGRTYVPIRYLGDALGASVLWDGVENRAILEKEARAVELGIGSDVITVNGESRNMDVAPVLEHGRTYLPARYVAEAFNYNVGWEPETMTILINLPEDAVDPSPEIPKPEYSVTWEKDVQLTDTGAGVLAPAIGADGDNLHVGWVDARHGMDAREIYYKSSSDNGETWVYEETRISNHPSLSIRPSFAVQKDEVLLLWRDNRHQNFEHYFAKSNDGGAIWGDETRLTEDPGYSGCPFPAVGEDALHIFWRDDRAGTFQIYYKRSDDFGDNWTEDILLTPDGIQAEFNYPAIQGDTIHLVWRDYRHGNAEIYYKRSSDGGNTWTNDKRLTDNPGESEHPKIVVRDENVYLVWRDDRDGTYEIYYKKSMDGGETWSTDTKLTSQQGESFWPVLAINGDLLHLIWCEEIKGSQYLYYMFSSDGGASWSDKTKLTEALAPFEVMGTFPVVVVDQYIHVVFVDDRTGNNEVYYKRGSFAK